MTKENFDDFDVVNPYGEIIDFFINAGEFYGVMGMENRLIHMIREIDTDENALPEHKQWSESMRKHLNNFFYMMGASVRIPEFPTTEDGFAKYSEK